MESNSGTGRKDVGGWRSKASIIRKREPDRMPTIGVLLQTFQGKCRSAAVYTITCIESNLR